VEHRDLPRAHRAAQDPDLRQETTATPTTSSRSCARSFGQGNEFCQKVTYRSDRHDPTACSKLPQRATTRASPSPWT
jgi:hypothetical protein